MSIQDVLKKSFLQGFQNTNLSMKTVALLLVAAGVLGIYLFFVYRIMTANTFYSKNFNVSLIMMCVITTAIIVTIQSSVVVSLGMVGALSIVRFRTAVKDPLDLIFMFWSISIGIICGAGMLFFELVFALLTLFDAPGYCVMIVEIILLHLFGFAWLTKGEAFPCFNDVEQK